MKTTTYPIAASLPVAEESPKPRFMPLRPISARTATWSSLLGVAAVGPAMFVSSFFPLADHSRTAFASFALFPFVGILTHVIAGPVLEEIVYRGGLLPLARRYTPLPVAVLLTSLVFGATHFAAGAATVTVASAVALILAWLALRSDSLIPGLICHMSFNFAAGTIVGPSFDLAARLEEVPIGASVASSIGMILPAWWIVASIIVGIAAAVIIHRETRARRGCIANGAR